MQSFISEKIASMPKFNDKILKILSSFENASSDDEVIFQIMNNPEFESRILDYAFSTFAQISMEKTLPNAFKFYGREGVRALFLFSIFKGKFELNFECYKTDRARFNEISLKRHLFLKEWIKFYPEISPDILSSVILMDFGRVFISEYIAKHDKNSEFYLHIKNCLFPQDFTDVEMRFTGMSRESVGEVLFKHFGLEKIAKDIYFSDLIDEAPFESARRYEMLKVAKTVMGIYHCFDERSIDNALNLLVEFGLEQEAFFEAKIRAGL
ncbi:MULTISPECIES: hypothetical protein [unclassified Campylobacter]|uniref:hypothetical protein n=1 Tax=unclassified Campylobacter TaxID=2593542 RepID=UPI0022E9B421|nr:MULTISPECIES: hypothetical protein [unclassified Campylobacter]MDA3047636.1 hypothetical protein [Campylobacter sp. JMF_08 NE1]WBR54859.1 hypothetical protein PF027_03030 [Campylobacter sp. VBCF_01 NA2]